MADCPQGFMEVARTLGGIDCHSTATLISVRSPFALANWTLPVVEALMLAGAVASLVHAVWWRRRRGDPTNLALWVASVLYALVLEPPLYFPDRFGLSDTVGLIFVHNRFSVQFLQDRLPLYILACYPALTYLAYAIVQRTGVLERRHPVVAAACVAFVFHCFYEIFDQLGPQLQWWAWNPDAPSNTPWLASVPLTSVAIFAGASPFGLVLLTRLFVARRRPRSMVVPVLGVAVLTPLVMMLFCLPYWLLSLGAAPHVTGQAIALWLVVALLAVVALRACFRGHPPGGAGSRRRPAAPPNRPDTTPVSGQSAVLPDRRLALGGPRPEPLKHALSGFRDMHSSAGDRFGVAAGAVFLVVFAVLWAFALPDYLVASAGRTPSGTPIGSVGYAIACAVVCVGILIASARPSRVQVGEEAPVRIEVPQG